MQSFIPKRYSLGQCLVWGTECATQPEGKEVAVIKLHTPTVCQEELTFCFLSPGSTSVAKKL